MSGLVGAILLTFGDGLARGIQPPLDIPVGVVIAIIGAPYFLFYYVRCSKFDSFNIVFLVIEPDTLQINVQALIDVTISF